MRVAFATAIFHISIALLTIGASDFSNPRVMVHTALWPAKIVYWVVLHLVVFFIPSTFFLGFGWIAFILGILFLLVQTVIFIEFVFAWNEDWIEKDGECSLQVGGLRVDGFTSNSAQVVGGLALLPA